MAVHYKICDLFILQCLQKLFFFFFLIICITVFDSGSCDHLFSIFTTLLHTMNTAIFPQSEAIFTLPLWFLFLNI